MRNSITHAISSYEGKETSTADLRNPLYWSLFYLNSGEKAERGAAVHDGRAVFAKGRIG